MIPVQQINIGDTVDFKGGYYQVEEIRQFPKLKPSGYWLTLKDFDNPVHVLEVKPVKQQIKLKRNYDL